MDRRYFREIFNLHAVEEKINYEGLCKIFEMVDFKPNEKQEVEFKAMFTKKEFLGFNGKNFKRMMMLHLNRFPSNI
jgi:hypothetical protein